MASNWSSELQQSHGYGGRDGGRAGEPADRGRGPQPDVPAAKRSGARGRGSTPCSSRPAAGRMSPRRRRRRSLRSPPTSARCSPRWPRATSTRRAPGQRHAGGHRRAPGPGTARRRALAHPLPLRRRDVAGQGLGGRLRHRAGHRPRRRAVRPARRVHRAALRPGLRGHLTQRQQAVLLDRLPEQGQGSRLPRAPRVPRASSHRRCPAPARPGPRGRRGRCPARSARAGCRRSAVANSTVVSETVASAPTADEGVRCRRSAHPGRCSWYRDSKVSGGPSPCAAAVDLPAADAEVELMPGTGTREPAGFRGRVGPGGEDAGAGGAW